MNRVIAELRARIDRTATSSRILIAGWLLFAVYAYPGFMTYDSADQLLQARGVSPITDWHPPMMAYLWRLTDHIIAGPFPMLVIQSVAFLVGTDRILRHVMSQRAAAISAVLILLAPPVLEPMAVIWKDSQMAAFLIAGVAALLSPRRRWQVAGCLLLFLATMERYNAAAATMPIVVLLFVWRDGLAWWKRYAISTGVWIAITFATFQISGALVEQRLYPWHSSVALQDIAGTIRYSPDLDDETVQRELDGILWTHRDHIQARIKKAYDPVDWHPLVTSDDAVFVQPENKWERLAVADAWKSMVRTHWYAYLTHRATVFVMLLELPGNDAHVWGGITGAQWESEAVEHRAKHSSIQAAWFDLITALDHTFVFKPWFYFVLAFAFLPFCRRDRIAFVLLASGLAYELAYFFVTPAVDYRYSHWMIVCTFVAGVVIFARRFARGRVDRG